MSRLYLLTKDGYKNISDGIEKETSCKEFLTELGSVFKVNSNLSIRTLNSEGDIVFKKVSDLETEDIVVSDVNTESFSVDSTVDSKIAYLIGLLYSVKASTSRQDISLPKNSVTDYISEYFYRFFDTKLVLDEYKIFITEDFIDKYKLNPEFVPEFIMEGNRETQKEFVKGFFDTNFIVSDKMLLKDFYSEDFLQQVFLILKNFGIIAEIDDSSLFISGEEIINYYNIIGTNNTYLEEDFMDIHLEENDFYQIFNLEKTCRDFYETTDKTFNFNQMNLNRKEIEKLIELDGDSSLKDKIRNLLNKKYCFERIVAVSNTVDKDLDIGEDTEFIINSYVLRK